MSIPCLPNFLNSLRLQEILHHHSRRLQYISQKKMDPSLQGFSTHLPPATTFPLLSIPICSSSSLQTWPLYWLCQELKEWQSVSVCPPIPLVTCCPELILLHLSLSDLFSNSFFLTYLTGQTEPKILRLVSEICPIIPLTISGFHCPLPVPQSGHLRVSSGEAHSRCGEGGVTGTLSPECGVWSPEREREAGDQSEAENTGPWPIRGQQMARPRRRVLP